MAEKEKSGGGGAHGATIHPCNCLSTFQDKKYGKGRRVHNFAAGMKKSRCTVCGKEKGE